eukprot:NODE_997_length_2757_cov_0.665538.p1 type:complete len:487 gc:universal NODE_997_length_2757_cov_0.665538:220-1680(+)
MLFTLIVSAATNCSIVIQFAQDLNMNIVNPAYYNSLSNCCSSVGVICKPNSLVAIDWSNKGLNGTLKSIPSIITDLILSSNSITGQINGYIPTFRLLVNKNKLNGTLPQLPDTMASLDVSNCDFTGMMPNIPTSIRSFKIDQNDFYGFLPPINLTAITKLFEFTAGYNRLSGSIPQFPDTVNSLKLLNNQFSGPFPTIPKSCDTLYIQVNNISGNLPLFSTNLTQIYFGFNPISGNISLQSFSPNLQQFGAQNTSIFGDYNVFPINLQRLFVSYTKLTGKLIINSPMSLKVDNTGITDLFILNPSILASQVSACDLKNTPLIKNPIVSNYSFCVGVPKIFPKPITSQITVASTSLSSTVAYTVNYTLNSTVDNDSTTTMSLHSANVSSTWSNSIQMVPTRVYFKKTSSISKLEASSLISLLTSTAIPTISAQDAPELNLSNPWIIVALIISLLGVCAIITFMGWRYKYPQIKPMKSVDQQSISTTG